MNATDDDSDAVSERSAHGGTVVVEMEGAGEAPGADTATTIGITFKLYATLQHLLRKGAKRNAAPIEVASDVTLHEVIDRFQVPRELAHLVLVNGHFQCDADRDERGRLKEGDMLAIWPPVAGG